MNHEGSSAPSTEAAAVYEDLFVPALFGEWAEAVAAAGDLQPGDRVLDVACGTGVLARAAAKCVGPGGTVIGLDPDDGTLPFEDDSFDAVVSQFGLMFFREPRLALREVRRVLRPGGRTVFAVWSSLAETPAYAAFVQLLESLFGDSAAERLRSPFTMGDPRFVGSLFRDAGFASPRLETRRGKAHFPSLPAWVEADARGWLKLNDAQHQTLVAEAHKCLHSFVTPEGSVEFTIPAHVIAAEK